MIPAHALTLYPRFKGCYVSIRYAGHNNDGKLHMVDAITHKSWVPEPAMTDVKWSKVQFISHDGGIALEAAWATRFPWNWSKKRFRGGDYRRYS